ncbi:MAG TPA: dihydroorotate dehydrogenase [Ktedonobacteraceae bacterium]|jgi:dihydroorotate dehydrogenase (NAD+) catalytic subunit
MKIEIELAPQHKSGLLLRNPVMLASGPSGYGVEYSKSAEIQRLGALVCAGVTLRPRAAQAQPLLLETSSGVLSAFDRPSPGVSKVLRHYAATWATWQTPVIVNLAGTSLNDFADLAARLDGVPGVAALELNLACPNLAADGASFSSDPALITRLIATVRRQCTLPIIAKLAPAGGDLRPAALAAASAGVDALALIHSLPGLSIDLTTRRPALFGGLSGPAIKPLALRILYDVARELRLAYPNIPLIGVGGIANAQDALAFILAGASAIQIGTLNLINPRAGIEILEGIEAFLRAEGIADIAEIIGAALDDTSASPD